MGKLFYNLSIGIFKLGLLIVSPFSEKARKIAEGRRYWLKYLTEKIFSNINEKSVWMHCASLGEFEQGRPVIEAIKNNNPNTRVFISFFSSSGYDIRKEFPLADLVFYLPSDNKRNARILFDSLNPDLVIFVKYEYWYHYTRTAFTRNIPVISISTILRPDQLFFRSYGRFYRKIIRMFDRFFVQNNTTLELLKGIGIRNAEISGDTRFDRVRQICQKPKNIEIASSFSSGSNVVVLGSIWPNDMESLQSYINKNPLQLKYIIAPHNIRETEIQNLEKHLSLKCVRISQAKDKDLSAYDVLIIDNIGMLSSLYQYGKIAYIGGAFNGALHNILEAATYGLPVIFGKHENNAKFQEAVDLVKNGGAFLIQSSDDFEKRLDMLFSDQKYYVLASDICSSYVIDKSGATDKIMHYINTIIRD